MIVFLPAVCSGSSSVYNKHFFLSSSDFYLLIEIRVSPKMHEANYPYLNAPIFLPGKGTVVRGVFSWLPSSTHHQLPKNPTQWGFK